MYILNITTNISELIEKQWLTWMKDVYIPAMKRSGKVKKTVTTQIMVKEEMGGITYSTQYFFDSKASLEAFYKEDQPQILREHTQFKGMFVDFSTELEVIHTS